MVHCPKASAIIPFESTFSLEESRKEREKRKRKNVLTSHLSWVVEQWYTEESMHDCFINIKWVWWNFCWWFINSAHGMRLEKSTRDKCIVWVTLYTTQQQNPHKPASFAHLLDAVPRTTTRRQSGKRQSNISESFRGILLSQMWHSIFVWMSRMLSSRQ